LGAFRGAASRAAAAAISASFRARVSRLIRRSSESAAPQLAASADQASTTGSRPRV